METSPHTNHNPTGAAVPYGEPTTYYSKYLMAQNQMMQSAPPVNERTNLSETKQIRKSENDKYVLPLSTNIVLFIENRQPENLFVNRQHYKER